MNGLWYQVLLDPRVHSDVGMLNPNLSMPVYSILQERSNPNVVHLHLTPAGIDILKEMREQALNAVVEMLAPLTPDERRRLADGLETLYTALGESNEDLPPSQ